MKASTYLAVAAGALSLAAVAGIACSDERRAPNPWLDWTTLQLEASAPLLFTGKVDLRVTEDSDGARLETTTTASLLGATIATSETTTRFDSTTGRTHSYESFTRKKGRRYTFGEHGYTVEKLRPAGSAAVGWEVATRAEYPYPEARDGGEPPRLFDYYGMLLRLRDAGIDSPGDEVTFYVATSRGPRAFRVRVSESRSGQRTITRLSTGEKVTLAVEELRLTVTPAGPEGQEGEGFLKMQGETEIWVEAESKTLLEIVGKVRNVPGKVKLVLSGMG